MLGEILGVISARIVVSFVAVAVAVAAVAAAAVVGLCVQQLWVAAGPIATKV